MAIRTFFAAVLALLVGATFASYAAAVPTVVDQYTEQIPTAGGEAPGQTVDLPAVGQSNSGGGVAGVPDDLSGPPGSSVNSGATDTSSGSGSPNGDLAGKGSQSADNGGSSAGSSSVPSGADSSVESGNSGSGLGVFFPLSLVMVAGIAAATVLMRRRSRARPHAG
jgi:hypothetical protein